MSLKIGLNAELPVGLFNKRLALLAMQGAGKTYTAGVIEEEMLDYLIRQGNSNAKLIIFDPVGAHWGIREKFPIHIVGGKHGDIDIDTEAGHKFADLSNKYNLSILFDLSKVSQDEAIQFVTDFSDRIYELTDTPTHIIYEEADMFAPQRPTSSKHKLSLAALDSIVRRGRGRGLGTTLITQRPAVLSKNVLTQVDASIILNISGETDLKTIREYLDSAGLNKKDIGEYVEKIMKFGKGHALLFSPSWLKEIKEIVIRKRISFHSGAEPELDKPNPADKVKLIPMDLGPLIDELNQEEIKPIIEPPRVNKWVSKTRQTGPTSNGWEKFSDKLEQMSEKEYDNDKIPLWKKVVGVSVFVLFWWALIGAFT